MLHIELKQVISQVIAFLVMVWVLKRFAWKPILEILDARRDKIKAEFDDIEQKKLEVQKLANEYQEKLKGIEAKAFAFKKEAISEGQKAAHHIQSEARIQAKQILDKAQSEANKFLVQAKVKLKDDMVKMVIAASQKLIKQNLDHQKQEKLVDEFMKDLQT
jgi:F-type H+-transporting ATPase subunit b